MAVTEYNLIRNKIKNLARDSYNLLYSDDCYDDFINEAQREYALLSNVLTGSICIENVSNVITLPDDFVQFIKFIDSYNNEVPNISWKKIDKSISRF